MNIDEKIYEFDAEIKRHDKSDAAFVEFPYDVEKEFGKKGQVKVCATFDGYLYIGSLVKMGHHYHMIGITKEVRHNIGKTHGDIVHVTIKEDNLPRKVEIPEDLENLLNAHSEANAIFNKLSFTHKKEYVRWIIESKKQETREKRLQKTIAMLKENIKHP